MIKCMKGKKEKFSQNLKRFGHTITTILRSRFHPENSKDNIIVMFGGATGSSEYQITNDIFIFQPQIQQWRRVLTEKNIRDKPSPRAAHSATAVENRQMVIFGGAHNNGKLVDNDLYLVKFYDGDCRYIKVPVSSQKPSSRYGHSMIYLKPYILVIGGNVNNNPSDEVWLLSIKKSPFEWNQLSFDNDDSPSPRAYHSTTLWRSFVNSDMILLFGGRNGSNQALNDLWGLRRHNNGSWDWIPAPVKIKSGHFNATKRYQHSLVCLRDLLIVIGGRNIESKQFIPLDVYNLNTGEWMQFTTNFRYRHGSFVFGDMLFIHAGFVSGEPPHACGYLSRLNLCKMFDHYPIIKENLSTDLLVDPFCSVNDFKYPINYNQIKDNSQIDNSRVYPLNSNVHMVVIKNQIANREMVRQINISKLTIESSRLRQKYSDFQETPNKYLVSLYSIVLDNFLKSKHWKSKPEPALFPVDKTIILSICDEVISILEKGPTLLHLRPGVKIFGSLHGQYRELLRFFDAYGVPDINPFFEKSDIEALDYLFLGNFVDRGKHSLEVILMLFALKLKFPQQIHLIRGSHEDQEINWKDGLAYECKTRLRENPASPNSVYCRLNRVFEYLPLAAVLGNKILCIHSGIGNNVESLQQIAEIKRPFKLNHLDQSLIEQKIVFDLLWSDPVLDFESKENMPNEKRDNIAGGKIIRFGTQRIKDFLEKNHLEIIVRSHECVSQGCEKFGNTNLYTIFSHSGYGGLYSNHAAILHYKRVDHTLKTLSLKYLLKATEWFNLNKVREIFQRKSFKKRLEEEFEADRPVTPPRQSSHKKWIG